MRPTWKGNITFGLVNISVLLYTAEKSHPNHFRMVDKRDKSQIRYQRVNENTGKEVPWSDVAKAYEYEKNNYIMIKPEEIKNILPEKTQTINIERFVKLDDLPRIDFQKPYYLVPDKKFDKGYVILREVLKKTNTVGIAKVVIHNLERLVAVMPYENALILEILRYESDLASMEDYDFPTNDVKKYKISNKELDIATQLVKSMQTQWNPDDYEDDYHNALQQWAERKIKHKEAVTPKATKTKQKSSNVIDFVDILQKSLKTASTKKPAIKKNKTISRVRTSKKTLTKTGTSHRR